MLRINKYLARCGVASRRDADNIVLAGRVMVNKVKVTTPGYMINAEHDVVQVDGKIVKPVQKYTYILLNKPAGYITSCSDPHHTKVVVDLVENIPVRVNPIGRLDMDTEGALLLTDDGELAFRLTHPKYGISKTYLATVTGSVSKSMLSQIAAGVKLPDGNIGKAKVTIEKSLEDKTVLRLVLTEGRKREVKHLCKAIGHPVIYLYRDNFAGLSCQGLAKGQWRLLTDAEVAELYSKVRLK
jgi:pseudouridine synthase